MWLVVTTAAMPGATRRPSLRPRERVTFAPISLILRKDVEQAPVVEEFARMVVGVAKGLKLT